MLIGSISKAYNSEPLIMNLWFLEVLYFFAKKIKTGFLQSIVHKSMYAWKVYNWLGNKNKIYFIFSWKKKKKGFGYTALQGLKTIFEKIVSSYCAVVYSSTNVTVTLWINLQKILSI